MISYRATVSEALADCRQTGRYSGPVGLPEPGLIYEHRSRVDHSGKRHPGAILTPNAHIHAA